MWLTIAAILRVIQQILLTIGITWFAFKLEQHGAVNQLAKGAGDIAQGLGGAIKTVGTSSPLLFVVLGVILIALIGGRR